jgi:hypothetical protein
MPNLCIHEIKVVRFMPSRGAAIVPAVHLFDDLFQAPLDELPAARLVAKTQQGFPVRSGEPKQLDVRPMKNKWSSCSTAGRVTFDTELMAELADFRSEMIVPERLHRRVPNHGRLFKALLKPYLEQYRNGYDPAVNRPKG